MFRLLRRLKGCWYIIISLRSSNELVIIPTFTCQTSVPIAVKYAGGIPLYVDVDKQMRLRVDKIKEKITRDIAAVVVHCYYGSVPDNLEELKGEGINRFKTRFGGEVKTYYGGEKINNRLINSLYIIYKKASVIRHII